MAALFAALSALAYGCGDFAGGLATRRSPVPAVVAWSQAVGIPVALAAVPLVGGVPPTVETWLWGSAAGLAGALGLGYLFKGLSEGFAAVVSPTAAVTGTALPVFYGVLTGERPGVYSWIGVAIVLPALVLLTLERGSRRTVAVASLRTGLLAGLGFGGFYILISRTGGDSGLWPLVAARTTSVPFLIALSLIRRRPLDLAPGSRLAAIGSGVLDMAANILFLLASRRGMIITAAVITALYPAPTVVLQRVFLKEHLGILRILGLLFAVTGIALIAAD